MKKVYVDNSATSFPKAPGVSDVMKDFLDFVGCNVNRGGYESAYNVSFDILNTRQLLCTMFNTSDPRNVIFTPSVTYSLNMILIGFLKEKDHVITTSMEHNAVMRPLTQLSKKGVIIDVIQCENDGSIDINKIQPLINQNTKAMVMTHASNVCGTILPINDISEICRKNNIRLIVDAAQTAGVLEINAENIDALAFTGHKGLLASQGIGGFIITSDFANCIEPLVTGGTGSLSHELEQPVFLPDKFEAGTPNIPAILGLKKAVEYINDVTIKSIHEKEMVLTEKFIDGVMKINKVKIVGKLDTKDRVSVVSLDFPTRDNAEISAELDLNYGIMTRCGLHCAPNAHKTLGTYPHGTVRFSFGYFNTYEEIDYIISSLKKILL